ncbi:hypothetical protein LOZ53_001074 [Ophidiomyces ophidiicola]|nr:hypothetical protein LOZ55_005501 [Ophidiomyces ophidiicola]KAI1989914.1 hypothetical protein LOZ54_002709 [Ophidiomyces ophidiicola]KAI1996473.1 hypothetical protein LOZ53_001074 [Ophidiomyces ophidiicola]KAI2001021.1 hypothetical protein LOZ51_001312 [Ophidiomyces ophidiicola]
MRFASANVEKTIFTAPPASLTRWPSSMSDIQSVGLKNLDILSPSISSIRKRLEAAFPSEQTPLGIQSWFFLADLNPGQRYELRICWIATVTVERRHVGAQSASQVASDKSSLLLAVDVSADYFTLNQALMDHVPPVVADIILDPYVFNVFPKSLIPTGIYILLTSAIAWYLSCFVHSRVMGIIDDGTTKMRKKHD